MCCPALIVVVFATRSGTLCIGSTYSVRRAVPRRSRLATATSVWQESIILAIVTGLSNARSEGYNRIVKHVGRIAFGFRTPDNQRRRVRWACTRQARRASSSARQLRPC